MEWLKIPAEALRDTLEKSDSWLKINGVRDMMTDRPGLFYHLLVNVLTIVNYQTGSRVTPVTIQPR